MTFVSWSNGAMARVMAQCTWRRRGSELYGRPLASVKGVRSKPAGDRGCPDRYLLRTSSHVTSGMKHGYNDDGRPDIPLKLNTFLMSRSPIATQAQEGSTAMSSASELFLNANLSTTNVLQHLDNGDDHLPWTQCPSHRDSIFSRTASTKIPVSYEYPKDG